MNIISFSLKLHNLPKWVFFMILFQNKNRSFTYAKTKCNKTGFPYKENIRNLSFRRLK